MSKGNLFLGFGRGKVGDVVFYRVNGEQVTRARNRSPKNPQTPMQLLQRVVMKTSALGYSLLQDICNHSFQGLGEGTPSQSRFLALNVEKFRAQLSDEINSGEAEDILGSAASNFSAKSDSLAAFNPYVVSEGTIQSLRASFRDATPQLLLGGFVVFPEDMKDITYDQLIQSLGLQRGDQLTFLFTMVDDRNDGDAGVFTSFYFARVILEPANGDFSSKFLAVGDANMIVNSPNEKNQGDIGFYPGVADGQHYMTFQPNIPYGSAGQMNALGGCACIASRMSGGVWQRSSESLALRSYAVADAGHLSQDHGVKYMSDAIYSFMKDINSSLYLNQATV